MVDRVRRQTALLVLLKAWQSYGTAAFAVNPKGPRWQPLHDAERLGWVSFIGDRCRITSAGTQELQPWRGAEGEAAD